MSKKSKIRWRKEDRTKVTIAVRNFNSKITRVLKKNPELAEYLPERISTADFINKIETRQDFNRELKSIQRFMIKGSETPFTTDKGIKTTKWFVKEIGYKVAQINRNRTRELKKADISTFKGTMGTIESNNLKPKKFNINNIKATDWEKYVEGVEKQIMSNYYDTRIEKYKDNYLKCIKENLGNSTLAQEFYNMVEKLDAKVMYDAYYDDPVLEIQFISDPLPVDFIIENAMERWEKYL